MKEEKGIIHSLWNLFSSFTAPTHTHPSHIHDQSILSDEKKRKKSKEILENVSDGYFPSSPPPLSEPIRDFDSSSSSVFGYCADVKDYQLSHELYHPSTLSPGLLFTP